MAGTSKLLTTAIALISVAALAACSSGGGSGSSSGGGSYKVVILTSLSGTNSSSGQATANGYESFFDYVNAKGGVNGHKIDYTALDDQTSTQVAATVAQQAVGDQPVAIVEGGGSAYFAPRLPIYLQSKIPVFTSSTYAVALYPTIYGDGGTVAQFTQASEKALASALGATSLAGKKVAVINAATPGGEAIAAGVKPLIQADGGSVAITVEQPVGAASFDAGASKIVSSGADVVLSMDTLASSIIEAKALLGAGFHKPFVAGPAQANDDVMASINSPYFHAYRLAPPASSGSLMATTATKFKHTAGVSDQFFSLSWALGSLLVQGLTKCGYPCSPDALQRALDNLGQLKVPGQEGTSYSVSSTNHMMTSTFQLYRWDPNKHASVKVGDPGEMGDPKYPTG